MDARATESGKKFWLNNFSDRELSEIATDFVGRPVPAEVFSFHRRVLLKAPKARV